MRIPKSVLPGVCGALLLMQSALAQPSGEPATAAAPAVSAEAQAQIERTLAALPPPAYDKMVESHTASDGKHVAHESINLDGAWGMSIVATIDENGIVHYGCGDSGPPLVVQGAASAPATERKP